MIKIKVTNEVPNQLRRYAIIANKTLGVAIKEEAKFLAKSLMNLFPPKNAKQGKNAVERDYGKVYLKNSWFTDLFKFTNQAFGERIKSAVRSGETGELKEIFSKSPNLSKLHIEPFNDSIISKLRRNGRVARNIVPLSFPVNDQKERKTAMEKRQKRVGLVKSGWASCLQALRAAAPAWLKKQGDTGDVIDETADPVNPKITLFNKVNFADQFNRLVSIALQGRAIALAKKADMALQNIRQGRNP